MNKATKIIIIILSVIICSTTTIIGTVFIQTNNSKINQQNIPKEYIPLYDNDTQTELNGIYVSYNNHYSFRKNKFQEDLLYDLFAGGFSNPRDHVTNFHELEIKQDNLENKYNSIKDNFKIFKVNSNKDWREMTNDYPAGDYLVGKNISTEDKAIAYFEKTNINFPYKVELIKYEERVDPIKLEYPYKIHTYIYNYKISDSKILNLGKEIEISYADSSNIIEQSRITENKEFKDMSSLKLDPVLEKVKPLSYSSFMDNLNEAENRLYQAGFIGVPINPYIEQIGSYGLDGNSLINVENLSIEYLYVNENSYVVPVIRVDAFVEGSAGKVKMTFWNWFIDLG